MSQSHTHFLRPYARTPPRSGTSDCPAKTDPSPVLDADSAVRLYTDLGQLRYTEIACKLTHHDRHDVHRLLFPFHTLFRDIELEQLLHGEKVDVVGGVDRLGDAVDRVSHWIAPPEFRIVLDVVHPTQIGQCPIGQRGTGV